MFSIFKVTFVVFLYYIYRLQSFKQDTDKKIHRKKILYTVKYNL